VRALSLWQWHPMASMVTMPPLTASTPSKAGIAVIAFDFPSTATWPSTTWLAVAQALTRWSGPFPAARSWRRRGVLPSMATTCPAVARTAARTQAGEQVPKAAGSRAAKARPQASGEGMPLGKPRDCRRNASLRRPNASIATQVSAPAVTARTAMGTISKSVGRLVRSTRGSGRAAKCACKSPAGRGSIAGLLLHGRPLRRPSAPAATPKLKPYQDAIALATVQTVVDSLGAHW
jgi:hypothetical protein